MHNQIGFGKLVEKSKFFPHPRQFRYLKPNPLQTHLIKFQTVTIRSGRVKKPSKPNMLPSTPQSIT